MTEAAQITEVPGGYEHSAWMYLKPKRSRCRALDDCKQRTGRVEECVQAASCGTLEGMSLLSNRFRNSNQ